MSSKPKTVVATLATVLIASAAGAVVFVWSGWYNVGADDPHSRPVSVLLEALRERSVDTRAGWLQVPDLKDSARVLQGAGNYEAMCAQCHLAPGVAETELSRGLYPRPPNLGKRAPDPAQAFWVVKHGIKATGMPAWGKSMDDDSIWGLAAFLQQLPQLDAAAYQNMVARSGGHSHGDGEAGHHAPSHAGEDSAEHGEAAAAAIAEKPEAAPAGTTHTHADGKQHLHQAPAKAPGAR